MARRVHFFYRLMAILHLCHTASAQPVARIAWEDLPTPAVSIARELGLNRMNFQQQVDAIERRTAARLREGEFDHLVYYMLQSTAFTAEPAIEPARSAAEYREDPRAAIPGAVERRIAGLAAALRDPQEERQRYFATLVSGADAATVLRREYTRAMRFLFDKEIGCRTAAQPQACVAALYANRGHSSDTSVEAGRAVAEAIEWIRRSARRASISRVLIIGPGVDFAPRTGLSDATPPRVYQPAAVAAALRSAKVAGADLRIDCADINARVLNYVRPHCNSAWKMNAVTEHLQPPPAYDLIVATNVLLYMDELELMLAFNNLRSMLASGGFFIHNDARFEVQVFGKTAGLPAIHFGSVILDPRSAPVRMDRFVVHARHAPEL